MNLDEVLIFTASILALACTLQLGYSLLSNSDNAYESYVLELVNVSILSLRPGSSLKTCLPYPTAFNSSTLENYGIPARGYAGGSCLEVEKTVDEEVIVKPCEP